MKSYLFCAGIAVLTGIPRSEAAVRVVSAPKEAVEQVIALNDKATIYSFTSPEFSERGRNIVRVDANGSVRRFSCDLVRFYSPRVESYGVAPKYLSPDGNVLFLVNRDAHDWNHTFIRWDLVSGRCEGVPMPVPAHSPPYKYLELGWMDNLLAPNGMSDSSQRKIPFVLRTGRFNEEAYAIFLYDTVANKIQLLAKRENADIITHISYVEASDSVVISDWIGVNSDHRKKAHTELRSYAADGGKSILYARLNSSMHPQFSSDRRKMVIVYCENGSSCQEGQTATASVFEIGEANGPLKSYTYVAPINADDYRFNGGLTEVIYPYDAVLFDLENSSYINLGYQTVPGGVGHYSTDLKRFMFGSVPDDCIGGCHDYGAYNADTLKPFQWMASTFSGPAPDRRIFVDADRDLAIWVQTTDTQERVFKTSFSHPDQRTLLFTTPYDLMTDPKPQYVPSGDWKKVYFVDQPTATLSVYED